MNMIFIELYTDDPKCQPARHLVLLGITPWVGVRAMAVTARILPMKRKQMAWGVLASLTIYAIALVVMHPAGVDFFT